MATMSIRLDATHTARVDEIVAAQPLPTSRNALLQHIATLVLQGRLDEAGKLSEMGEGPAKSLLRLARDPEARARFNAYTPGPRHGHPVAPPEPSEDRRAVYAGPETDGARCKRVRKLHEMTQEEAANDAGVSEDQFRRYERGVNVSPAAANKLLAWAARREPREGGAG